MRFPFHDQSPKPSIGPFTDELWGTGQLRRGEFATVRLSHFRITRNKYDSTRRWEFEAVADSTNDTAFAVVASSYANEPAVFEGLSDAGDRLTSPKIWTSRGPNKTIRGWLQRLEVESQNPITF